MFFRSLILLICLELAGGCALAERVFKTVNPNTGTDITHKFDTNMYPVGSEDFNGTAFNTDDDDINIAPKIIFAPDGSKAFVVYAGTSKLLVFNPSTGEVITSLDTSPNPSLMSITPDGKTLAVPCLYIKDNTDVSGDTIGKQLGAIEIFDVATHERKTLQLTKVFFSFGNNIVFSQDSRTGYVASAGTDEILRFDLETATEITPRLKMPSATRPGPLTMSPLFDFFAVVQTGWKYPATLIPKDEVVLINTATFDVLRHLSTRYKDEGETEVIERFFDFRPTNNIAITSDGKWGVIADQLISHQPNTPGILTNDRVMVFDLATGEIKKIFRCGNFPGEAVLGRDGNTVIIASQVAVASVDPANLGFAEVQPILASFLPSTRPVFSADGKRLYVPVPTDYGQDETLVFNWDTGAVQRFFEVGKWVADYDDDDDDDTNDDPAPGFPAGPLEQAFSPDGRILASLNFNTNTIDLIQQTDYFTIPLLLGNESWFTGVAILNNNPTKDATIELIGYNISGVPYTDTTSTTEVVEYTNPNTYVLKPGEQKAFATGDLLKPSSGSEVEGTLEADSDVFETTSFFLVGDAAVKRLDGAALFLQEARTVVLPEVRVTDGFKTEISLHNYTWTPDSMAIEVFDHNGESLFEGTASSTGVIGRGQVNRFVRDPDGANTGVAGLVDEDEFTDDEGHDTFTNGYVVIRSRYPTVAIEKVFDAQRLGIIHGIPKGSGFNDATRLYVPQVAAFAGSDTFLNLINIGTETASVTLALKDSAGVPIVPPVVIQLEKGKTSRKSIVELFGLTDNGQVLAGWIQMDSDKAGVIGNAEVRAYSGKAMTFIPLVSAGGKNLIFSHVAQGLTYSTGLSLLNPQAVEANALIEIFKTDGTKVAEKQVVVPAGGRLVNLLKDQALFPDLPDTLGGYIKVTSDQDLIGLEIFFTDTLELLAVVPAQTPR